MATLYGRTARYSAGGWTVQNDEWGTTNPSYSVVGTYNPSSLTKGLHYTWSFGSIPSNGVYNVYAFPNINYGQDAWNTYVNPADQPFPLNISQIATYKALYNTAWGGATKGYNVAFEMYLTSTPSGGKNAITDEVMIWIHDGGWHPGGKPVTTYKDSYYSGSVYSYPVYESGLHFKYTALLTTADDPSGTIDIAAILKKLKAQGIIKGSYVAGVQLGAEIAAGSGWLTVNDLKLDIQKTGGTARIIGADQIANPALQSTAAAADPILQSTPDPSSAMMWDTSTAGSLLASSGTQAASAAIAAGWQGNAPLASTGTSLTDNFVSNITAMPGFHAVG